jgi:Tfp pilus assembly protein PilN
MSVEVRNILYNYLLRIKKNNRLTDFTQLLKVYITFNKNEIELEKAKDMLNQKEALLIQRGAKVKDLESRLRILENEKVQFEKVIEEQKHTIDNMAEGMIARCDICHSEEPV